MSRAAVIVALLLALTLSGVAWLALRPPAVDAPPGAVLDFEPSRVTRIEVTRPGSPAETLRRVGPDGWVLDVTAPAAGSFPVQTARVRNMLRILSTLTGSAAPAAAAADAGGARITLDDGTETGLRFLGAPIAGRVRVSKIPGGGGIEYLIAADIYDALIATGPRAWRDDAAIPGLGAQTARVSTRSGDNRLSLARVQGRWAVTEPVAAPADEEAILRLVTALASVRIADFLDEQPDPSTTGLASPSAIIRAENDSRELQNGEPVSRTTAHTLALGGAADIGGGRVFAAMSTGDAPPRVVAIDAASLGDIPTRPEDYISKRALIQPAADIGGLEIDAGGTARSLQRGIDGWTEPGADGSPVPVLKADADAVSALLDLLTETRAQEVLRVDPASYSTLAEIEVRSLGGDPLDIVEIATVPGETGQACAAVRTGRVWRIYPEGAGREVIAWLTGR
jgi:hypothetical protein